MNEIDNRFEVSDAIGPISNDSSACKSKIKATKIYNGQYTTVHHVRIFFFRPAKILLKTTPKWHQNSILKFVNSRNV